MQKEMPFAVQIPLLHLAARSENPHGLRVPQSGWLHEPKPGKPDPGDHHGPVRNTYKRSHRWARSCATKMKLLLIQREDKLLHVLFSTIPDDLGLYGKPMARTCRSGLKIVDGYSMGQTPAGRNQKNRSHHGAGWSFRLSISISRHASRMP